MRRTLAGCEFGICLDLLLNNNSDKVNGKYIIVDKNPLLMFTIYTWSMKPLLAGILIILLVYVSRLAAKIAEIIINPASAIQKFVTDITEMFAVNNIIAKVSEIFFENAIGFLNDVLQKQLDKLGEFLKKDDKKINFDFNYIVTNLRDIFIDKDCYSKLQSILEKHVKFPSILGGVFSECFNYQSLVKVGLLLILCFATFLKNFQLKRRIEQQKNIAKEFDSAYTEVQKKKSENPLKVEEVKVDAEYDKHYKKAEKMAKEQINDDIEFKSKPISEAKNKEIVDMLNNDKIKHIIGRLMDDNTKEKEIKITDIKLIEYPKYPHLKHSVPIDLSYVYISTDSKLYQYYTKYDFSFTTNKDYECELVDHTFTCIRKSTNQKCIRYYYDITDDFCDTISFFIKHSHPSILPFVGYVLDFKKSFVLFEIKTNKYLYKTLNDSIKKDYDFSKNDNTKGLILAYGIACGMEFLEKNKIFYKALYSRNILLDDDLRPYIFPLEPHDNSYNIICPDDNNHDMLTPPEISNNIKNWHPKTVIYTYGTILFEFSNRTLDFLYKFLVEENGPDKVFQDSYDKDWIDLMINCLNENPDDRPTFSEICDTIESFKFKPKGLLKYIEKLKPFRILKV